MIKKDILHKCHEEGFSTEEVFGAYQIFFGTLVSATRLKIINILREKQKNVSEIMNDLNMDQTAVSHDLARLKKCGFVNVKIDGKFRYYTLNNETISPLMKLIDKHMSHHCIHILEKTKGGMP